MAVEPLIFELSKPGRRAVRIPLPDVPETPLPEGMMRERLDWPEVSEIDVIRHYTRLSQKNHAIDIGMYPLGSCTMKYNPKINEVVARFPGFANIHPYQDPSTVQAHCSSCGSCRRCWARYQDSMRSRYSRWPARRGN